MRERACERASVRACVNACMRVYESVCFTDVKADPGLRIQVTAVLLFALTSCKIPVDRSLFVAANAIGENPLPRHEEQWFLYEGAVPIYTKGRYVEEICANRVKATEKS